MSGGLRSILIGWQFWALELQFLLVAATTAIECPRLIRRLPKPAVTLVSALAVSLLSLSLTVFVAPRTSRIFYDEQIYEGVAQNLTDLHLAQMCNEGTVEYGRLQCTRGEYNKEPNGYPYLLSLVYRVAGVSDTAAFRLNNVVGGLTAGLVVLLSALLFGDLRAAAFSGLMLALMPMHLTWSNTAAAEPSAALLDAFAFLVTVHYARSRTTPALAWMIAVLAFATTFRPESILILPLAAIVMMVLAPRELTRGRFWGGAVIGALLSSITWLHLAAVRGERWGAAGSRLAWSYVKMNLPVNLGFYVGDGRFPVLFTAAAVVGLVVAGRRREKALVAALFLVFWGIFVAFYAGSYDYGADVRYSLLSNVPIAVLAGAGASWLAGQMHLRWPRTRPTVVLTAVMLFQFLWYVPLVRSTGEEAWGARADVAFAKEAARSLPRDAIVLTQNPAMFQVWGVNAAQMSLAVTDRQYVRDQLFSRYAGGVFLHWNFWCNVADPAQVAFCDGALGSFAHDLIVEHRERDYRYALYELRSH